MIEQIRAYLAANYPASIEGENHRLDESGNITAWGFSEFGEPPTREQMLAPASPTPRTEALRPAEIRAAREAIAQAEDLARQSTQTKYRDALLLLTATFDGVLAKLGGEQ